MFKRHWFQTLMHIAVTSLWILPVIRAGAAVRIAFMIFGAAAHAALPAWFNFAWVNSPPHGIDGGPLGFLTWAIPALVGTLDGLLLFLLGDNPKAEQELQVQRERFETAYAPAGRREPGGRSGRHRPVIRSAGSRGGAITGCRVG